MGNERKPLEIGKVPESVLKRAVFGQIGHRREEVDVGPGVGKDCSVLSLRPTDRLVLSTDPITGARSEIGALAVHVTANDIASSGADVIGMMASILLPRGSREEELRDLMRDIERCCGELGIEVLGGHTEVTDAVSQPVVTMTGVGALREGQIAIADRLAPSDELVLTKWAGMEGTAILAREKKEALLTRYSEDFIEGGERLLEHISVVRDAKVAKEVGVSGMHDVTEGGIFGALWEVAAASRVGLEVDLRAIPLRQETVEICEFFGLNPYMLMSSGCLLIATRKGNEMVRRLSEEGIPAALIGRVTKGNDRVLLNAGERRFLEPPRADELYKVDMGPREGNGAGSLG